MIEFRRIALAYKYGLSDEMCERILASIDISDMGGYTIDDLGFLNSLNIPIFEYRIFTPKELNEHLIKVGKSVYMDYMVDSIANTWNAFLKRIKGNE
mgnify:CR=1 FL=1